MTPAGQDRIDRAARSINADRDVIYRALTDPEAIVRWRPPEGMHGEIHCFDARVDGKFRMSFFYADASATSGKTTDTVDTFEGRFVELTPGKRVVEEILFLSNDPAFAEPMLIETDLEPDGPATRVVVTCRNVPHLIRPEDHQEGLASSLAKLAAFVE